jgi:OFA family oxalate/formate antiporter-like MFS transporter
MLLMFSAEGIAFLGMAAAGRNPLAFVVFAALIFLFWGEIFSLFPAICGDTFGVRHATANNGLLYTAKGTAALAVPLTNFLVARRGVGRQCWWRWRCRALARGCWRAECWRP